MSTAEAIRAEERAARAQQRNLEKAHRAAAAANARAFRERVRDAAREYRFANPRCHCDFRAVHDREDLIAMSGGCTDPIYVCPRLDAVRRKVM